MKKRNKDGFRQVFGLSMALLLILTGLNSCSSTKNRINRRGLYSIKLGDKLPAVGVDKLEGVALRDTLFEDEDYTWRAAIMQYKNGIVYLEEDFGRSEILNRIRVETPELSLKNGLRVGNTVADLKRLKAKWYIAPLERFEVFDFYSALLPNIHFIVSDPSVKLTEHWENYSLENFKEEAGIVAIVIF